MGMRALVTGGTGSVGREIVQRLTHEGYEVLFTYNQNATAAKGIADETGAQPLQIDLAMAGVVPDIEPTAIVINNAAVNFARGLAHEVTEADFLRTLEVNVLGPWRLARWALPTMISQGFGRIVNIGSIYSFKASERNTPYTASKHALSGLTKTVALEYAQHGITCNEIHPGPIDSELLNRIMDFNASRLGQTREQIATTLSQRIPTRSLLRPCEVARAVSFLISEDAGSINGAAFVLDGGLSI